MKETLPQPNQPAADPQSPPTHDDGLEFAERAQGKTLKSVLKEPVMIAAGVLALCIVGFVIYLESGNYQGSLPPPEISYELLRNEGLTEGVPIAVKVNHVSVFMIDDPMAGGQPARAKEIVANLEGALEDLRAEPGRTITIITDDAALPTIVQSKVDGSERRVLIQLTPGDVVISEQPDPKWLSRTWAERVTDSFKVYMFGEAPKFAVSDDFGAALTTLYLNAKGEKASVSIGGLDDAYEDLSPEQQVALASFPPPPPEASQASN